MPFGLKNVGETYQQLVDEAFQSQIGQNLEAYVDDMVVKSKSEKEMLADIAEIFDNLRRINMKLNLKKCLFGVEEGKFLGYMVTSEGIRANLAKTKDIAEMQSPKTWGEMQSLAGKLAALNRFLSRPAEKQKMLSKNSKNDPGPTGPYNSTFEGNIVYIPGGIERSSQCSAAGGKERKAIFSTLCKLAQYSVEPGAYNITYEPHNAIKGQILADFINEVLVGDETMVPRQTQFRHGPGPHQPYKTEYTYALRLNFESTNNQAEYKALLAGLRIAKKIGVQSLSVNVDSKLVASQINGSYEACKENMI
ncbi:reverse transcriptase domain-containing protein [Tanacetum coccineum]